MIVCPLSNTFEEALHWLFALMQVLSHSLELAYFVLFSVAKAFTLCLEVDLSLVLPNTALMLRSYYFLKVFFLQLPYGT